MRHKFQARELEYKKICRVHYSSSSPRKRLLGHIFFINASSVSLFERVSSR